MSTECDKYWYLRQTRNASGQASHCPIATVETCPRYYVSLKLINCHLPGFHDLSDQKRTDIEEKWQGSETFRLNDFSPATWEKRGQLHGVSDFCPEVTGLLFGLYCSDLRRYADAAHREETLKVLKADDQEIGYHQEWAIVEPKHYLECREFSIYGSTKRLSRKTRTGLRNDLRWRVFERDQFTCFYCGSRGGDGVVLQVDHKISKANGGGDELENLVTACERCNGGKGARNALSTDP